MTDISSDISTGNSNDLEKNSDRINVIFDAFQSRYGSKPIFFINVPGRVNLIGEHIDYCGYPVLPMAIEQSILLAISPSNDRILEISNTIEKYEPFKCAIDDFEINAPENGVAPPWYDYFLCGVRGIFDEYPSCNKRGMLVTVSGNIPPAAGLSSSSALVSSSALATSLINDLPLNKFKLADISAKCERYIGTEGGGMDQAIAYLATEGSAQFIEWEPLTATPISLPSNAHFVIANSLTKANKAATSDFNQRVIECQLGCKILAKYANLPWQEFKQFANLQSKLDCSLHDFERFANQILTQEIYSQKDIATLLEITEDELNERLLTSNTNHINKFKIRQRALHVIQEAIRVNQFRKVAEGSGNINELGTLMRESHRSLNDQYECSHENVNKLINISDELSIGARLTGAGWGGCIVAICDSPEMCDRYIKQLKEKYFQFNADFDKNNAENIIFATNPQRGASFYTVPE